MRKGWPWKCCEIPWDENTYPERGKKEGGGGKIFLDGNGKGLELQEA